jgi:hypothetical protein
LKWRHQFTPHDLRDFYVLDWPTGEFLFGAPFVNKATWDRVESEAVGRTTPECSQPRVFYGETYLADGQQFVAIASGNQMVSFALPR